MIANAESALLRVLFAVAVVWPGLALAQSPSPGRLPAQALTPGQGSPLPAQAPAPANPPDAPVPSAPVFPPPGLPRAEPAPSQQATPPSQAVPPRTASQPAAAPVPNADLIIMLVRSTLAAFNHANLTNDYSVLHALAAPSFRQDNAVEKLRDSFAGFRDSKIDIAAVQVLAPRFVRPAEIDGQGILRVTGLFPSRPLQLRFDLAYQAVEGRWRFAALAVDASPAPAETAAVSPPAAAQPAIAPAVSPASPAATPAARPVRATAAVQKRPRPAAKPARPAASQRQAAPPRQPKRQRHSWTRRGEPPVTTKW